MMDLISGSVPRRRGNKPPLWAPEDLPELEQMLKAGPLLSPNLLSNANTARYQAYVLRDALKRRGCLTTTRTWESGGGWRWSVALVCTKRADCQCRDCREYDPSSPL